MSLFDFFKKAETEVKDVENEVESIVTGPVVKELVTVIDKVVANANNPFVVAGLAEVGITPVEIAATVKTLQMLLVLINKVEVVVQNAVPTTTTVSPDTSTTPAPKV